MVSPLSPSIFRGDCDWEIKGVVFIKKFNKNMSLQYTDKITALNAVIATTTSSGYDLSLRSQITIALTAAAITSGTGTFTVDASNDGTNWVTGIAFRDATGTASTTWVTSKVLSSNSTAGIQVPAGFRMYRVVCTVVTDGAYTATIEAAG